MITASKWCVCLACCLVVAGSAQAWQAAAPLDGIKRIYVEAFTVKGVPVKLRDDVIAELRKLNVSIVSDRASAGAILTGDGETWIKGYRSLNPRSGRLPSNGTPVYAGFLSVELKDAKGETLWSYLAAPASGSDDISKDLAKRIAKHLAEALAPRH
jgi:hypothetical protein